MFDFQTSKHSHLDAACRAFALAHHLEDVAAAFGNYENFRYLSKKESPAMQLTSGSTGWLELPNVQRWNPGHQYKFNARLSRRPWWSRLFGIIRGCYGH